MLIRLSLLLLALCLTVQSSCRRERSAFSANEGLPHITEEMQASIVRVHVTLASTVQRLYPGFVLNQETSLPPLPPEATQRLIALHVPDFEETSLRDPSCEFRVHRSKVGENGQPQMSIFKAKLLHLDAATRIAIIQIQENFPIRLDQGYRAAVKPTKLAALDVMDAPAGIYAHTPIKPAVYRAFFDQRGLFSITPAHPTEGTLSDHVVVLGEDSGVAGFASRSTNKEWTYRTFTAPRVTPQALRYVPQGLKFISAERNEVTCELTGSLDDPFGEVTSASVLIQNVGSPDFTPAKEAEVGSQPPIIATSSATINLQKDKPALLKLKAAFKEKETSALHQLVQIQLTNASGKAVYYCAPFLVSLQSRGRAIHPALQGIALVENTRPGAGANADLLCTTKDLSVESAILYGLPMRDGREVLIRIEEAPYWKRLQLEGGNWLPLPEKAVKPLLLAGNKEAIFTLNPESREITRYHAATLAQEAAGRLPSGLSYQHLAAGAASVHGPVTVVTDKGAFACDPHTLTLRQNGPGAGPGSGSGGSRSYDEDELDLPGYRRTVTTRPGLHYQASADGRLLRSYESHGTAGRTGIMYSYEGPLQGFRRREASSSSPQGSTGSFAWNGSLGATFRTRASAPSDFTLHFPQGSGQYVFPTPSSPLLLSLKTPDFSQLPPSVPRASLHSYFHDEPLFEFTLPEFNEVNWDAFRQKEFFFWFDPHSLSVALSAQGRTIRIRSFDKKRLPAPQKPTLLNFPDGIAPRGRQFAYSPLVWAAGTTKVSAKQTPAGAQTLENARITWEVPADEISHEQRMNLHLQAEAGENSSQVEIPLSLLLGGTQPVVAVPPSVNTMDMVEALRSRTDKSLPSPLLPLPTRYHASDIPIQAMIPGLDDYLLLKMKDGSINLFSLREERVVGARNFSASTTLFPAGDSLLIYDAAVRTLSRLSLPDLQAQVQVLLPEGKTLLSLGAGEVADAPVCLVLTPQFPVPWSNSSSTGVGDLMPTTLQVLEKQTLKPGKWAQLTLPLGGNERPYPGESRYGIFRWNQEGRPGQLPATRDGRLMVYPFGHLVISPTQTTDLRLESKATISTLNAPRVAAISAAGDRLWTSSGLDIMGRWGRRGSEFQRVLSRSGDYLLSCKVQERFSEVEILAPDGFRPLVKLINTFDLARSASAVSRNVLPLSDHKRIASLNASGTMLQLIEFDAPEVLKKMLPATALPTSHAHPVVMQGGRLEFQVTVNHPETVESYRLLEGIPGATLSTDGKFTFPAPAEMNEVMKYIATVEITLKDRSTVMHEFPIFVVPVKKTAEVQQPVEQQ